MIDHLDGKDIMTLFFERTPDCVKEEVERAVGEQFKSKVGLKIVPKSVTIGELPRSEKKTTRIFDNRY